MEVAYWSVCCRGDCCGAGVDAEFLVDVVEVAPNRVGRDDQLLGDLAVREASGDVLDDFALASGEAVRLDALLPALAESCEVRPQELKYRAVALVEITAGAACEIELAGCAGRLLGGRSSVRVRSLRAAAPLGRKGCGGAPAA